MIKSKIMAKVPNMIINYSSFMYLPSQILLLFHFPFSSVSQRVLSHGLPPLSLPPHSLHPPHSPHSPLLPPHSLPLTRKHPSPVPERHSPTPLPPLLNTPLPLETVHHLPSPHHAASAYHPREHYNDVHDVGQVDLKYNIIDTLCPR